MGRDFCQAGMEYVQLRETTGREAPEPRTQLSRFFGLLAIYFRAISHHISAVYRLIFTLRDSDQRIFGLLLEITFLEPNRWH